VRPVLLWAIDPAAVGEADRRRVAALMPGHDLVVGREPGIAAEVADRVDVLAGWLAPEVVIGLPRLRWYQQWIAGADWLLAHPEAVERPFVLTSASGVSAHVVADQVMGFILAFTRRLPEAWARKRDRRWEGFSLEDFAELEGKTLLVAGVGAIGGRVARRAGGFGLRTIGVRRHAERPAEGFDVVGGAADLLHLVAGADVIVSALPCTRETAHMFGRAAFAAARRGALFVSVGRGKVVDEAALVAALTDGRLAGAALDVYEEEPLPAASPLWDLPGVILTQHWGAAFPGRFARTVELLCENLTRDAAGRPLRNLVDKAAGY